MIDAMEPVSADVSAPGKDRCTRIIAMAKRNLDIVGDGFVCRPTAAIERDLRPMLLATSAADVAIKAASSRLYLPAAGTISSTTIDLGSSLMMRTPAPQRERERRPMR